MMRNLKSFRPISELKPQVGLFIINDTNTSRWKEDTNLDEAEVDKPLKIHYVQGCVITFLCPMRCLEDAFEKPDTNCTLVYFPRFDFYPLDSHVCKLRLSTNFDDSQIELRYCIVRWLRKAMLLCRTIFREFNSIRA